MSRQKNKTRPTLRLSGQVRTEIADCVTGLYYREPANNLVQLFNLGTINLFGLPGSFVIRFFLAKPNQ